MSFSETELQQCCNTIIASRRIKGKIVILCEGGNYEVLTGRPSPSSYRAQAKLPDANFYKACVPVWWELGEPEFFVCGDRKNVIDVYFKLKEMHEHNRADSYLDRNKLFAIIDLDLQPCYFENYLVENSEQLYHFYYTQGQFKHIENNPHSIFITGLIYKEAYFLIPELQELFDNYRLAIHFENNAIDLETIYQKMAHNLVNDTNLQQHFNRACERINYLELLELTDINTLQQSWLNEFNHANDANKNALIYALLTIHQVKNYWKSLQPNYQDFDIERFREQLTLEIGNFYAMQPKTSQLHLPCFFKTLLENRAI